jgi:hypothetical protein
MELQPNPGVFNIEQSIVTANAIQVLAAVQNPILPKLMFLFFIDYKITPVVMY